MEIIWIVGLAILSVILLVFYLRERSAYTGNIVEIESKKREIKALNNQVSHHKHNSTVHSEAFIDAENKIKSLGFSGVDDIQLEDPKSIDKIFKVRESLKEGAAVRYQQEQKRKRDLELKEKADREKKIRELAEAERKRLAIQRSRDNANRTAQKYRDNGSYQTDNDGMISFIPALGAVAVSDYSAGSYSDGGFSGSGGSFSSDSGSGGSFSSDSGGGGGGGGE